MSDKFTQESFLHALHSVGVNKGDIILIHSDLRSLGMPFPLDNPSDLLPFYLTTLQTAVGPEGTLAVPAYFYEYARFGIPFDTETSPVSLPLGSFSSYLNQQPGRIRSCNPLQSIAAIGPKAEQLTGGDSLSGYGTTSPWHRLRMMGGKILFIGVSIQPMTYIHYVEQQYGVPHLYCKVYSTPVFRNRKQVDGTPISAVRYLDFNITYDLALFEDVLLKRDLLKIAKVGKGDVRCVSAQDVYDSGIDCLDKNPYYFLKHPPDFVPGKIPYDGVTGTGKKV